MAYLDYVRISITHDPDAENDQIRLYSAAFAREIFAGFRSDCGIDPNSLGIVTGLLLVCIQNRSSAHVLWYTSNVRGFHRINLSFYQNIHTISRIS